MKPPSTKITCIIPTFNRGEFLSAALACVLKQTYKPLEVIIVNNGADEVSLPASTPANVKVHRIVFKAGASQARNAGASLAQGDFLAFLDDDDLWGEDYLENVAKALEQGADCVFSRLDKLKDGIVMPYKNPHGKMRIEKFLISNPGCTGSNVVIKRDMFMKIGGFDVSLMTSNDKSFAIEVLKSGANVITLPDNQAITREHGGDKLTVAWRSAEGTSRFIAKYRKEMSIRAYLANRAKYFKYGFQSGKRAMFFPYVVFAVINKIMNHV